MQEEQQPQQGRRYDPMMAPAAALPPTAGSSVPGETTPLRGALRWLSDVTSSLCPSLVFTFCQDKINVDVPPCQPIPSQSQSHSTTRRPRTCRKRAVHGPVLRRPAGARRRGCRRERRDGARPPLSTVRAAPQDPTGLLPFALRGDQRADGPLGALGGGGGDPVHRLPPTFAYVRVRGSITRSRPQSDQQSTPAHASSPSPTAQAIAIRVYGVALSFLVVFAELGWTKAVRDTPLLQNWASRGAIYAL